MKLYQVRFDTNLITALANNEDELKQLLLDTDDSFVREENGDLKFYFTQDSQSECEIEEIEMNDPSILQWESH